MSYTNQTQNYGLPQYVGTDVPAWLTDVNGAFASIDRGMNAAKTQADAAATTAGQAANDITSINSTLQTQATQISAASQAAAAAQTTANNADNKADLNTDSITALDTRVEALEQNQGFTAKTTRVSQTVRALGNTSLYITDQISLADLLPTGKTLSDVLNIFAILMSSSSSCWLAANGVNQFVQVITGASGTLDIDVTIICK